ncbi:Uncharacterized protein OS=Planctomyces limnophilus (strain ATCC 43296 / DSM 3776 / IFAM 1008 / 290) GN=Plim_3270 PE=4 SV=1: DUF2063 [Gemmataceae bacterium]|nr:Uncharacterized protein OS=Planctomyces limnophilus (strain ATCC 43296 / DSM 3776 / IFAM 1008 / 290) GN=Plim_3270 PE=4 SV=1: DUF2063 [Gemmataceae bacterium]VTT99545.1 Uncharacterized protein OS=Planctomyces limnophilus (strain ATCC 43296 / DSM 3776 / IFAM 1008 / 290) GN=Plim_3270 PE=4 SV=1: DUF2063 [Gemmataceae bacterium]
MPNGAPELDRIQRWMQAVIAHPAGVAAGCASDEARRQLDVDAAGLERVVTRSSTLLAAERLAVYANAYYARLLECLREEYPALVHTLGSELFDEFAVEYLQRYPSGSYTLHHLGANFPRHLAETCPAEEDTRWANFVVDLAKLERLFSEVFDGPGNEGATGLSPEALAAVPPESLVEGWLVPAPDLHLVELRSPVHEYVRAVRRGEDPAPPAPADTLLAVHRRDYLVRRHPVSRPQYVLLAAILAGETVGKAIGKAAEHVEGDAAEYAADLRDWFRDWAAEGLFRDFELKETIKRNTNSS